jgi:hypothetical protein
MEMKREVEDEDDEEAGVLNGDSQVPPMSLYKYFMMTRLFQ